MFNKLKTMKMKNFIFYSIIYLVIILFFLYPTPYEILLPGGVNEASRIITIEDQKEASGAFYSSYVSVITKPSSFQFLTYKLNRNADYERLSKSNSQLSVNELRKSNEIDKEFSIQTSIIVAYKEAGKDLVYDLEGLIVNYRSPSYDAFDDFRIGDIITAVNGEAINMSNKEPILSNINQLSCDEMINFTILRENKVIEIQSKKSVYEGYCKLGVSLYDYYTHFEGNPKFTFNETDGLGSSAGLMQTLSIYNALIEEDITRGLKIAGTGVIGRNGDVLSIAGIKQKVLGAIESDMDIYFAPNITNSDGQNLYLLALEAKALKKSDIKIVPVKTFAEAVKYLKEYKE